MLPDGFGYLQMADQAAHDHMEALVNAYWSPGYPALLSIVFALIKPSPESAFGAAHFLNYVNFLAATAAFVYFLRGVQRLTGVSDNLAIPLGFVIYLKFSLDWLGLGNCTPDLAVGVVVLTAAGI